MSESAPGAAAAGVPAESWWREYLDNPAGPFGATVAIAAAFLAYRFLDNALTGLRDHTPAIVNHAFIIAFFHAPVLLLIRRRWAYAAMAVLLCVGCLIVAFVVNLLIPMFATPLYYALFGSS